MNFFTDNEDLLWYVNKGVDWDELISLVELNPDDEASSSGFSSTREISSSQSTPLLTYQSRSSLSVKKFMRSPRGGW